MTKTQIKTLVTLINLGGNDIDITWSVKGVHAVAKYTLAEMGLITIREQADATAPGGRAIFATVTAAGRAA